MIRFSAVCLLSAAAASGAELVRAGAGSFLRGLPEGVKGPPALIYKTAGVSGPMPTNDWWSSLAWLPLSESMFPHPLGVRAVPGGLQVNYPGAALVANAAAIMGGGGADLVLGHSAAATFSEARVAGWSDWFVTARMGTDRTGMSLTFGHGSPFVFAEYSGGSPAVTLAAGAEVFAGAEGGAVLGVRTGRSYYGLFAPSGSVWSGAGTSRLVAETHGKPYFTLALLPDGTPETLALFRRYAYAAVKDSKVAWHYDAAAGRVETTFRLETRPWEGDETGTLFELYPHQWHAGAAPFTGHHYASVRGPLKLAAGTGFSTGHPLPAVLPSLPLTPGVDRRQLRELLAGDLAPPAPLTGDTYWLGKQLGKWATMLPLAEQAGDQEAVHECDRRLRTALEQFLDAADSRGGAGPAASGLFAWEPAWGTLIGYPASYGSDDQINDHHFHYGYFLRAAGEIARRDPAWAARWKDMLQLIVRDIASPDRADPLFPWLRCFDPYAGHSWASGHAKFGDGNNNESSSEAVNAWFGVMLLGEALGDRALRDLGAWLLATEVAAIEDYWFDVRDELHPGAYPASVVTMVWGGKGANGTWFSASPESIHGINFLPLTGASLYLGRWPEYVRKNYAALLQEKQAAQPDHDSTRFETWADIFWMYRALSDPDDARRHWEARPPGFKPEAGNSLAQTCAWIAVLQDLGTVERAVTADTPFAAVFTKGGKRTHAAWNLHAEPKTVTFSDGFVLECPPRGPQVR